MNKPAAALSAVLKLFALLFTDRWFEQWQRAQPAAEQASGPHGSSSKKQNKRERKKNQKKKSQSQGRGFYKRIFTLRVIVWYLIFQRLNFDQSLAAVVRDLRQGGADRLGARGRKLSQRIKSSHTSGYNQARQRMPLALLQAAFAHLGKNILALTGRGLGRPKKKPGPPERERQLLDGSTLRMLATPELQKAYRPARGPNGRRTDWCLMRILVGFCTRTGAILSVMEKAAKISEQTMAWAVLETARAFTIWIADRNFGVWSVVAQAVRYQQDVVVRLTKARAGKLAAGRALRSGEDRPLQWHPSRHDKSASGTKRQPIAGRLLYVRMLRAGKWIDLWLFTTLQASDYPLDLLVQWYGQRWQAELHFRSVKTQMRLAHLDICSPEMARKELYAGLLAYNLVRAVMWAAGERLESGGQSLSFNNARRVVLDWLRDWARGVGQGTRSSQRWVQALLEEVAQQKLPKRKKPRPSQVRMVRSRFTKWPILRGSRAAAQKRHENRTKSL